MLIIKKLFMSILSTVVPSSINKEIMKYLPSKEQHMKKKRMHRDLWFLKNHRSEGIIYSTISEDGYYTSPYEQEAHILFANSFLTWKDGLYSSQNLKNIYEREAHETLLFDIDGEKTNNFMILNPTNEYIKPLEGTTEQGTFLQNTHKVQPIGIDILNIISKALEGDYKAELWTSGFSDWGTGDYENTFFKIENSYDHDNEEVMRFSNSSFIKFMDEEYAKWESDPNREYTGLIIGDRKDRNLSNIVSMTPEGDVFFSIFLKPKSTDICSVTLQWEYKRDEIIIDDTGNRKCINGPMAVAVALRGPLNYDLLDRFGERI